MIPLLAVALVCGLLAGWATGGSMRRLSEVRLAAVWLLWTAVLAQLALPLSNDDIRLAVLGISLIGVGVWLGLNLHRPAVERVAVVLTSAGWAANTVVMIANAGMPVSRSALVSAGLGSNFSIEAGHLSKHVAQSGATFAPWLGDIVPLRMLHSVISLGDVAMAIGIALLLAAGMRRTAVSPTAVGASQYPARGRLPHTCGTGSGQPSPQLVETGTEGRA